MGRVLTTLIVIVLLGVHALLVVIGVAGLMEWFVAQPPWPRFSNPELPRAMLALQWLLLIGAGAVFVAGYLARWRWLPFAMAASYLMLGAVCAVETFTMLTNEDRFTNMAIEYLEYTAILLFLFGAPEMRRRFRVGTHLHPQGSQGAK
ncbi:MAG: hypothetical protein IT464_14415 [Planctomycetes bacterium]|nr:hypothetical protein [Planctomycetota bacterium]